MMVLANVSREWNLCAVPVGASDANERSSALQVIQNVEVALDGAITNRIGVSRRGLRCGR